MTAPDDQTESAELTGVAAGRAEARRRFGVVRGEQPATGRTASEQGRDEARRRFGAPPQDAA